MTERLRHRLEIQSATIEQVFGRHDLVAQVSGGRVEQDVTRFVVEGNLPEGRDAALELQADLADSLNARQVQIQRDNGRVSLTVLHRSSPTVCLLDLLHTLSHLPPYVAALGWAQDERPVLLNLEAEDTSHVLVSGVEGAGKTSLLRTCAVSLALHSRQSQVQMIFVEPDLPGLEGSETGLHAMLYLPHVLAGLVTQPEDAADVLAFLREEMDYRGAHGILHPRIVLFLEHLASLLEVDDGAIRKPLHALLAHGATTGIHLVMSTRRPGAKILERLLQRAVLLRLVGQMPDRDAAVAVTGAADSGAEHLLGRGDFMAWRHDAAIRFQAAYLDEYDLHLCLERLHRRRPPALVARPVSTRARLAPVDPPTADAQSFLFDGRRVVWPSPPATLDEAV